MSAAWSGRGRGRGRGGESCSRCLPELPQGSALFTLLEVSPQGSGGGGATVVGGGGPPAQGSEVVGEAGEATPQGSAADVPHGPEGAMGREGGGEGPAEPAAGTGAAAAGGGPQGSTALSSMRALCMKYPFRFIQTAYSVTFRKCG